MRKSYELKTNDADIRKMRAAGLLTAKALMANLKMRLSNPE
jgi:hypothetical protein